MSRRSQQQDKTTSSTPKLDNASKKHSLLSNDSLGILSLENLDISGISARRSSAIQILEEERELAVNSINRASTNLTSLPSRFLKKTEVTTYAEDDIFKCDSTISESDLVSTPPNSSTPRNSSIGRPSIAPSLFGLSSMMNNPNADLLKTLNSFCSSQQAEAQLNADEMSWKNAKFLPERASDFSATSLDSKLSMGAFFKEKSDELPKLLAKSPVKVQPPKALIDLTQHPDEDDEVDTFSVSAIGRILADSQQTPGKLADYFLKPKLKPPPSSLKEPLSRNCLKPEIDDDCKENVDSLNVRRCASSLSSLPNGKLPIDANKPELIWGCVKVGKNASQDFIIRNKSESRIGLNCTLSNPSFKLIKEGAEMNFASSLKVILHPFESRTVTITLAPTVLGATIDKIEFLPIDPHHKQTSKQFLRLFGYGGNGQIVFQNLVKDVAGKFLLCLGIIDEVKMMEREFFVKNVGTLPCFIHTNIISNGSYSIDSIELSDENLVLLPDEERAIIVRYTLKKDDLHYMQSKVNTSVFDIAKLNIIWGTEVDRGRLRKLYQKCQEKNITFSTKFLDLIEKFPIKEAMPSDLKFFKESPASLEQMYRFFNFTDITLTLERSLDYTVNSAFQNDSVLYYTLSENTELTKFETTTQQESCHVEPTRIILTSPNKLQDMIFITNNSKKEMYFEVNENSKCLRCKPKEGYLKIGETAIVNVIYLPNKSNDKSVFKVKILIDDEAFDVDVKVLFIANAKALH